MKSVEIRPGSSIGVRQEGPVGGQVKQEVKVGTVNNRRESSRVDGQRSATSETPVVKTGRPAAQETKTAPIGK